MNSDQDFSQIRDVIPRLWYNFYQGCLQQGFNESQSFALLQTYILSQNPHGIKPPTDQGPPSDNPEYPSL